MRPGKALSELTKKTMSVYTKHWTTHRPHPAPTLPGGYTVVLSALMFSLPSWIDHAPAFSFLKRHNLNSKHIHSRLLESRINSECKWTLLAACNFRDCMYPNELYWSRFYDFERQSYRVTQSEDMFRLLISNSYIKWCEKIKPAKRKVLEKEGDPPTTQASSAAARSSCPRGASRAQGAGAAKIR